MRTPSIAGTWYPKTAKTVLKHVGDPEYKRKKKAAVLIVPHAGYQYSGTVAAKAYAKLNPESYDKVIILAPSHHVAMYNSFSVEPEDIVKTPFGNVTFSKELHDQLSALPGSQFTPSAHPVEHAIDIQLPLIKKYLPNCEVGGMIVGHWDFQTTGDVQKLTDFAKAFREILNERTLIIISTDFTHYGPNYGYTPFTEDVENTLPQFDNDLYEALAKNNNNAWAKILHETGATICGASCLHLLLATLPKEAKFTKLEYANSAEVTKDWNNAVGYTTALIEADWSNPLKRLVVGSSTKDLLTEEDGATLTKVAEYSLRLALFGKENTDELHIPKTSYDHLQKHCGAFVTLTQEGQLRGCIGEVVADRPVLNVVFERARSAAFEDKRFRPVTAEDFGKIHIEVTALSTPYPISNYKKIVLGRDGIILNKDGHSAVFLPQVATEQGWDLTTTLSNLSLKAGLTKDAWKEGAELHVFQAQIFEQKKDYYSI